MAENPNIFKVQISKTYNINQTLDDRKYRYHTCIVPTFRTRFVEEIKANSPLAVSRRKIQILCRTVDNDKGAARMMKASAHSLAVGGFSFVVQGDEEGS